MILDKFQSKWLLIIASIFLFFAYEMITSSGKIERKDLKLNTKISALIISKGECVRRSFGVKTNTQIFIPKIEYEYTLNSQLHKRNNYFRSKNGGFNDEKKCNDLLKTFANKEKTDAWIDPREPSFAALDPKINSLSIEFLFLFISATCLLSFIYINFRKK
jgi:hypothetical protein